MISSVSRAVALVTTPTQPFIFQTMMLFEPMEPTSTPSASSMTSAEPLRSSATNGSLDFVWYQWETHWSYWAVSIRPAGADWVGT